MSTQSGLATIHGFTGFANTDISWTGIGTLFPQNFEFRDDFSVTELRDQDNEPWGLIAHGQLYRATLQFTPVAATGTNTIANAKTSLPPPSPLARVTLQNFPWSGANSATWVYVGGFRLAFSRDGLSTYALDIAKSPNRDLSTPIS